jgi:hypothetical protein
LVSADGDVARPASAPYINVRTLMPLDFLAVTPQIERVINLLKCEYSRAPASILTEDDLKCLLYAKLIRLVAFRRRIATRDGHILGSAVHAELSWYDENRRLRIRPDITITEPECLSILHGYGRPMLHPFSSPFGGSRAVAPLPSKQYEFGGNCITFELKFAREGITDAMMELIRKDFAKMKRLFGILDRRGQGDSVFSYLVIFNKLPQRRQDTPLAEFMREHGVGPRHKVLYRTCSPRPYLSSPTSDGCWRRLVLGNPPFSHRRQRQ